jgi:hypothetical protein
MQKNELEFVDLNEKNRLYLYAGNLDLIGGHDITRDSISRLKHAALFNERLIVHDGCFHCYGPLSSHLSKLISNPSIDPDNDEIVQLLKTRILVPALRRGVSVLENWDKEVDRIFKGTHLVLRGEDDESRRVLEFASNTYRAYANNPTSMRSMQEAGWDRQLEDSVLKDGFEHSFKRFMAEQRASLFDKAAWHRTKGFVNEFVDELREKIHQPDFRRGWVEDKVGKLFGECRPDFDGTVYTSIADGIINCSRYGTPQASAAYYLLCTITTSYQVMHAHNLQTTGGLFAQYNTSVVQDGIYERLADVAKYQSHYLKSYTEPMLPKLDLSALTVEQIDVIRGSDEFAEYCTRMKEWLAVESGDASRFDAARERVSEWLNTKYLPRIVRDIPASTGVAQFLEATGTWMDVAGTGAQIMGWLGTPIVTVLCFGGKLMKASAKPAQRAANSLWDFIDERFFKPRHVKNEINNIASVLRKKRPVASTGEK